LSTTTLTVDDAGDGDGSTYAVTVSGITGDGTLGLDLAAGTDIQDSANNSLETPATPSETYTIDTTPPVAEITRAAYGSGPHAGQLDIRWEADDRYLASRPVTLQFSQQPDGPWTPIAAGLPNTGQYHWRVDSRVPDEFYLRLQVRDEAGNTATDQLDRAIPSEGLIPKGYVHGLTPAEPSGE
jgi:hypothetical protein